MRSCEDLCAYCASTDHHRAGKHPDQVNRRRNSLGPIASTSTLPVVSRFIIQIHIQLGHKWILTTAFVDSGVAGNVIDHAYTAQLVMNFEPSSQPVKITAVEGQHLQSSPITRLHPSLSPSTNTKRTSPSSSLISPHHPSTWDTLGFSIMTPSSHGTKNPPIGTDLSGALSPGNGWDVLIGV